MQITTETFGNVMVIHTPEEVTEETADRLLATAQAAIGKSITNIVAQMDRSEFFDSVGLTTLLDIQDLLREHGGNLKLCALTDHAKKILEVTRLDRRFDIFASAIDAVSSFQ